LFCYKIWGIYTRVSSRWLGGWGAQSLIGRVKPQAFQCIQSSILVSLSALKPSSKNRDSSLERPLLRLDIASASDRLTRNDSPPDRVLIKRFSPAFHRSITTISFRSTPLNAYPKAISNNWWVTIVMSRSNMVCRAKSFRLFAGITLADFLQAQIFININYLTSIE